MSLKKAFEMATNYSKEYTEISDEKVKKCCPHCGCEIE